MVGGKQVNLVPAPGQTIEYVAILDDRIVATVFVSTDKTNFPALMAKKLLAQHINAGVVMYVRVGKTKGVGLQ